MNGRFGVVVEIGHTAVGVMLDIERDDIFVLDAFHLTSDVIGQIDLETVLDELSPELNGALGIKVRSDKIHSDMPRFLRRL